MSYEYCDADGEVNVPAPTISGLHELGLCVDKQTAGLYPQLTQLIGNGVSHQPLLLAAEASALWDKVTDPNLRSLLSNLAQAARHSKGFISVVM
jgi:hypothetical protein